MTEKQEIILKLSEGYSTQSKTTNKFWLVLIIASIIGLVGRPDEEGLIELPFTLGRVFASDFYSINIILISIVIIAFSSAMAQTIRTRKLIQKVINDLNADERFVGKVHMQDFFDSISSPTYSKVAPIAQLILGKNQFFGDPQPKRTVRRIAKWVYVVYKSSTFVFLYVVPVWSLVKCWANKQVVSYSGAINVSNYFLVFFMILAGFSVVTLFVFDIMHIKRAAHKIQS